MRLLTKTVPLSPSRSERAFGTPLTNTSTLKPLGSLSCGIGSLSAAIGNGGGLTPRSLPAASELGWLGVGGGGGGVDCWAVAGPTTSTPASKAPAADASLMVILRSSLACFSGIRIQTLASGRGTLLPTHGP